MLTLHKGNLITIEDFTWKGPNNSQGYRIHKNRYKIEKQSSDTLVLSHSKKGQHNFINVEILKKPTRKFRFLKLDYSNPLADNRIIEIDSSGEVFYQREYVKTKSRWFKPNKKVIKGKLSNSEFDQFKKNLSDYLAIKLPEERVCGIDAARSNFKIKMNGQIIKSQGCILKWIHGQLLEYLLTMDKNKGLIEN